MNHRNSPRCVRLCGIALAGLCGLAIIGGCDKGTTSTSATAASASDAKTSSGSTGVVDLDKVAAAVQWKAEIDKDNETARAELGRLVVSFANEVNEKVKQHKSELAKTAKLTPQQIDELNKNQNLDKLPLTKEQLNTLVLVLQNAQQYVQNVDQHAGQQLQKRRNDILQSYRDATRPIVRQVAEQQGLTMVLLKLPNDAIFYNTPNVDVTDKVIDEVRRTPPKITYPSMPTMNLPTVNLGEAPQPSATAPSATKPAQ